MVGSQWTLSYLSASSTSTPGVGPRPTTAAATSNKPINRRTANDYAGSAGEKVFTCPVSQCTAQITEEWTVEKFYKHMEDAMNTTAFYEAGTHVCPYGCSKGLMNEFSLHRHVQNSMCR